MNDLLNRRQMLTRCGMGMGAVALTSLLGSTGQLAAAPIGDAAGPFAPKAPPLPAKAKRIVHLFMNGGASHVDTFDPKPALGEVCRQADSHHAQNRAAHRRGLPVAVRLPQVRPERHRDQ